MLGSDSSAMETRLCVVGKENGENKELMQAIEVNKVIILMVGTLESLLSSQPSQMATSSRKLKISMHLTNFVVLQ